MCLGTVQNNRAQCENSLFSAGLTLFLVIELKCFIELRLHFYHASNIYTCPSFWVQSASQLLSVGSSLISWRNRLFTHIFLSSSFFFFFKIWLVIEPLAPEVQSIYQTFSQQMKHVKTTQLQFLLVRVLRANNKDLCSVGVIWEKNFPASTLQQKIEVITFYSFAKKIPSWQGNMQAPDGNLFPYDIHNKYTGN